MNLHYVKLSLPSKGLDMTTLAVPLHDQITMGGVLRKLLDKETYSHVGGLDIEAYEKAVHAYFNEIDLKVYICDNLGESVEGLVVYFTIKGDKANGA